jgi:hypothetical protein
MPYVQVVSMPYFQVVSTPYFQYCFSSSFFSVYCSLYLPHLFLSYLFFISAFNPSTQLSNSFEGSSSLPLPATPNLQFFRTNRKVKLFLCADS